MKSSTDNSEQSLRAEIAELKRKLEEERRFAREASKLDAVRPSRTRLVGVALLALVLIAVAFVAGYLPKQRRELVLGAEAKVESQTDPVVNVVTVGQSSHESNLTLPGSIQAVTESPVLARSSGYVRKRNVDIGDRVNKDQVLCEIEAPELLQMLEQARATLAQSEAAMEQAVAAVQQGRANEQLAKVTAARWESLARQGIVSKQDNDTYQAQYEAQRANVQALEKAVAAAKSNIAASQANFNRLTELSKFPYVRAPFAGVITLRNIDVGTLVTEGTTLLYRIAQTDRLRTYVNVPQADAGAIRVGQTARLAVSELPGREFAGTVTRTANAFDPATRTLLAEVQVANADGKLLPGMYADVTLASSRANPPLMIPGDTLLIRPDGPQVAIVDAAQTVHFQRVKLGRDYGNKIEVLSGLTSGQRLVVNPGDTVREGVKVNPK
jgi:RND family efflux transporter MFP subunit